jgi:Fe-S oxidoreductase
MALGLVLAFLPYFAVSKHIHIFFAPLNFLIRPRQLAQVGAEEQAGRRPQWPVSLPARIDFEDESIVQYGAARLEHLPWPLIQDAYACIQCNRCQEVCPANATGKSLSPSALEINKRYFLNREAASLAAGKESSATLLEFAISEEALWACTTCGACVEICPVKNEPMLDILEIRRNQVLTENLFPDALQNAFRGMERQANPWGLASEHRLDWAKGLPVPTLEENPQPEILWWVGCAPATEPRAQRTARDFARILEAAGVNYAVLGSREKCTGDSARRAGNEYLFSQLAQENVQTLNEVRPRRIVTTCPHCLHTLANEYPQFGGRFQVLHHSQLICELIEKGKLPLRPKGLGKVAYHDPCYLGRQNGVLEEPRELLRQAGMHLQELPRNRSRSFCCGAGGGQMWKEEEPGRERLSANRFREVESSGVDTLAVACPFCMIMLSDASRAAGEKIPVRDVAEIIAQALPSAPGPGD